MFSLVPLNQISCHFTKLTYRLSIHCKKLCQVETWCNIFYLHKLQEREIFCKMKNFVCKDNGDRVDDKGTTIMVDECSSHELKYLNLYAIVIRFQSGVNIFNIPVKCKFFLTCINRRTHFAHEYHPPCGAGNFELYSKSTHFSCMRCASAQSTT